MSSIITKFSQLDLKGTYSYADYLLWQFSERVELIKGKIFKMSPAPSSSHQDILMNLTITFNKVFSKTPCKLYFAPLDVRLINFKDSTPENKIMSVVQPDLCVIFDENKLDQRGAFGAPDLVIEILSPGNSKKEMKYKFDLYQEAGVLEYWIVNPTDRTCLIYVLRDNIFVGLHPLIDEDTITSPLFPQLDFILEEIFN